VKRRPRSPGDAGESPATLGAAWTPATAVITREVATGHQADYQEWSGRLLAAAARVPGYQGATLVGPPHSEPGRRMLILRFSDRRSLRTWVDSEQRKSLTAEAAKFSNEVYEEPSSLETWFAIPAWAPSSRPHAGRWHWRPRRRPTS
jgi:antibiotic biosynthesis monooxygenase (ABM) superfamily enzyme